MLDIRVSLNYDNGDYMAEYVEHNRLKAICEGGDEKSVIRQAKRYVEDRGKEGRVISTYGTIYEYKGKEWKKTEPVK